MTDACAVAVLVAAGLGWGFWLGPYLPPLTRWTGDYTRPHPHRERP